jgi:hypothetical protein
MKDLNKVLFDQYNGLLNELAATPNEDKTEATFWAAQCLWNLVQVLKVAGLNKKWSAQFIALESYDECHYFLIKQTKGDK